jgi:Subtilase family
MAASPRTFEHPSFGRCVLVPSLIAIKWTEPLDPESAAATLSEHSLMPATAGKRQARDKGGRDPRPVNVNQGETLAWATATRRLSDAALTRLAEDDKVEWVAPAYRAAAAEPGPQSYFAVNPTVLLLSQAASAAVGELSALDADVVADEGRSALLKGWVVLNLPKGNAIELAGRIRRATSASVLAEGVRLENIPYISPTCCGCSGASSSGSAVRQRRCTPSATGLTPDDTLYPNQWGLERINSPRAWPLSEGDPNVVVAVLDQGVDLTHPDLNLWPVSYSTVTHTNDGSPVGNHGTACAGIIAAKIDNSLGVAGLAGGCRAMAIATNFADTEVAEGLYFAADNGARVVSMSFGVYPAWMIWDFSLIQAALQYCQDRGLVLVAASGNENANVSRFPGSDPRTICVGGSNRDDMRKAIGDSSVESWWGACFGPDLDVVAPCLEIPTTDRQGAAGYTPTDYDLAFNGTSSATPHVAGLAALILSVAPSLGNLDVRRIISETTDKINTGGYVYGPTAGKPFGTWNDEVGYGRINVERALLVACASGSDCRDGGPCCVELPVPEPCCVSPCDPPWRPEAQCLVWYDTRSIQFPLGRDVGRPVEALAAAARAYIEFRITYEHRLCLLGKQHGPLLYTLTLLPHEKATLYHSERYRQVTSVQQRYSVQTTFMQFLSVVHEARVTSTLDALSDRLTSARTGSSGTVGGGFFGGFFGFGGESSSSSQVSVSDRQMLRVGVVADQFSRSAFQASQLTHAERSLVVSTYEDRESADITARTLQNENDCRAVTYFVRQVVELYALSTIVTDVEYHIVAPNVPPNWHSVNDLGWLPAQVQSQIKALLPLLPKVGEVVSRPRPITLPTDGAVYDPELAHCCSCEPEREAAIAIQLERQKAEALRACLEAQLLEIELQRRRMLLQKGDLTPYAPPAQPTVIP